MLAAIAALGVVTFLGVLVTARGPLSAQARIFAGGWGRRRPVRRRCRWRGVPRAANAGGIRARARHPWRRRPGRGPDETGEGEVVSATRFSSAGLPALSLDAPDGWTLEWNKVSRKLTATGDGARLLVQQRDPDRGRRRRSPAREAGGDAAGPRLRGRRHLQRSRWAICRPPASWRPGPCDRSAPGWSSATRTSRRPSSARPKASRRRARRAGLCSPSSAGAPRARTTAERASGADWRRWVGHERIRVAHGHHAGWGGLREDPVIGLVRDARFDALVVDGGLVDLRLDHAPVAVEHQRQDDAPRGGRRGAEHLLVAALHLVVPDRQRRADALLARRSRAARRRSRRADRRRDRSGSKMIPVAERRRPAGG